VGLIEESIKSIGLGETIILDGFPRTVHQAKSLEGLRHPVGAFLNLEVQESELVKRLSARRVCSQCSASYHLVEAPPQKDGCCDRCGGALFQRDDDKAESIQVRLRVFQEKTAPLVDFYKDRRLHYGIKGSGEPEEVYKRLFRTLNDLQLEVNR
jgi:adenylate kinase